MSLVDYAASDDDVSDSEEEQQKETVKLQPPFPLSQTNINNPIPESTSSSNQNPPEEKSGPAPAHLPSFHKLPDASMLFDSPLINGGGCGGGGGFSDHESRIAAAMAESSWRKRELNALSSSSSLPPRSKIPRGNLPHSKNVPETGGGSLVPPQLKGRSNVVTEDISKLFVKRNAAEP